MLLSRLNIPPFYLFLSIIAMLLLHFYLPVYNVFSFPYKYFGLVLIFLGLIIIVWKASFFKRYDTPIQPFETSTYLIKDGLYHYTRNPIYLAMVALLVGFAIILGSLSQVFVIPIFVVLIQRIFIEKEEKQLEEIFAEDYLRYKKEVRRWI